MVCNKSNKAKAGKQCSVAYHASAGGRLISAFIFAGGRRRLLPAGPSTQQPGPPACRLGLLFSLLPLLCPAHASIKLLLLALRLVWRRCLQLRLLRCW